MQRMTPPRSWYLYLLECRNGRLYSGITTDLAKRLAKHASGKGAMFTRLNPPLRIVAATVFENRAEASRAEYQMKQLTVAQKLEAAAAWPAQVALPSIKT
jgi:putative endonuclease